MQKKLRPRVILKRSGWRLSWESIFPRLCYKCLTAPSHCFSVSHYSVLHKIGQMLLITSPFSIELISSINSTLPSLLLSMKNLFILRSSAFFFINQSNQFLKNHLFRQMMVFLLTCVEGKWLLNLQHIVASRGHCKGKVQMWKEESNSGQRKPRSLRM